MTRAPSDRSPDGSPERARNPDAIVLLTDDRACGESLASSIESASDRLSVTVSGWSRFDGREPSCFVVSIEAVSPDVASGLDEIRERHPATPIVCYGESPTALERALDVGVADVHAMGDEPSLLAARLERAIDRDRRLTDRFRLADDLESLVSTLPGIVYRSRVEPDWPMTFIHGECAALTGYTAEEFERGAVSWGEDVIHEADRDPTWKTIQETKDELDAFELTYRIVTRDGTTRWVWERGRWIDRERTRIEGFIADVTNRRERAEQLQVISHLLRHNLRNDMTVVRGYAEMIAEESSQYTEEIEAMVDRIDGLLATAAKTQPIVDVLTSHDDPTVVDVADTVERAVRVVETRFDDVTIDRSISPVRAIGIAKLERAIVELVENAVIHNDRSEPTISIAVRRESETVTIEVADDGPPIPEMERDVLSDELTPEPLFHGTGLGLWLVQWIVRRSGGSLRFDDRKPRGNVVTIELQRGADDRTIRNV
ncbi:sensor histidine kinase [Halovivax gelatinilyticus]|uniref:sensor histidine kinase n=1 Tax=Halovivax gelatinilyticus TaxID=2961597 RepID=UPI0020CA5CB7|nr:PAS domain-containing sensor histidine kinase [Halovivax gelatinilyticus]